MTTRARESLFLVPVLLAFVIVMIFIIPTDPFDYDPSDYMYAASRGFIANYTDENGISFYEFLEMGWESGRDPAKRAALSEHIRASEDIALYRHFHAPLSIYYLILVRNLAGENEYTVRWAMVLVHILCSVMVYFGSKPLAKRPGAVAGAVPFLLYLTSIIILESVFKVSPHALHIALTTGVLLALSRFHLTKRLIWWYGSVALLCLAMLTYEYALFLLVSVIAFVWLKRKHLFEQLKRTDRRSVYAWSAGLFILLFFLLWPAGILKLTVIRNYIFIAYFALVRRESIATDSAVSVWWNRLVQSPFESILLMSVLCVLVYRFFHRKEYTVFLPFLLYIGLMLTISIGNSLPSPTYVSSLYASIYIPVGVLLADGVTKRSRNARFLLLLAGGLLLISNNLYHYIHRRPDPDLEQRNALILHLRAIDLRDKKLLAPKEFFPSLHYYFREARVDWYLATEDPLASERLSDKGKFDIFCYRGEIGRALEQKMQAAGYPHLERIYEGEEGKIEVALFFRAK